MAERSILAPPILIGGTRLTAVERLLRLVGAELVKPCQPCNGGAGIFTSEGTSLQHGKQLLAFTLIRLATNYSPHFSVC
jgi:hypothetical protein